jgi:hypothetical protein
VERFGHISLIPVGGAGARPNCGWEALCVLRGALLPASMRLVIVLFVLPRWNLSCNLFYFLSTLFPNRLQPCSLNTDASCASPLMVGSIAAAVEDTGPTSR